MGFAGLLNINKPSGISSFGVVRQVKRVLGVKKVGHCGTLDPLAEGVLLVVCGRATKMQEALMKQRKVYRTRLRLGLTTDTGDVTGKTLKTAEPVTLPLHDIRNILDSFAGEIEQVPPMYSALKYGGRPLYALARKGIEVERAPRKVTIHRIELLGYDGKTLDIEVECSSGTYIRTLGEDIGRMMGCGATVETLRREQVGPFTVSAAIDGARLGTFSGTDLAALGLPLEELARFVAPGSTDAPC